MYGCDEHSDARELVTVLLEDPFAPDTRKEAVRNRWNGVDTLQSGVVSCVLLLHRSVFV